ncbi:MAG: TldD/PmbA family protein [Theionarchaea archaeon]|nr:TldD/PmbA family protein [Theionarchaea archaeon]
MDEDIAEYALEVASTCEATYADVRLETQKRNDIVLKNGILDAISHTVNEGMGIRIITEEGVGFSSTSNLDKKSVKLTVKEAFRQSKACKRKTPPRLSEEKPAKAQWSVSERKKLSSTGIEQKLDDLFLWEKSVSSLGDVPARIILLTDKQTKKLFLNSEGSTIEGYLPVVACFYFITVKHNHNVEQVGRRFGYVGGWETYEEFRIVEDAEREVTMLKNLMEKGKKSPQGKMDVVAGPDVVGIACHESCGHPTEADRILGREASQAGASFMSKELLNTQIGSEQVTIVEDPTLEHSFGFYAYDDEGVKTRRRFLFKDGYINEFLHNRESAAAMGVHSNAAARSTGYNRESIVRMANTFLLPGDYSVEEIIEDVKRGVYMKSYTEWNIDDKRYNQKYIGRESYLIENGEIKHIVKRPVLELTTPAFWKAVDACGKDFTLKAGNCGKGDPLQEMEVSYGGPTARLRNIYMR